MRILITGVHGQIGSHLTNLVHNSCECWAVGREEFDLEDPAKMRIALKDYSPTLIINTAAYTDVDGAETNREYAFALNALAPRFIAEWCLANNAALIHFSTDYVYDGVGGSPYLEETETRPINVYGESKLAGDVAIAESGIPYLILRTSWLYDSRGKNFLLTMLRLGAKNESLSVVSDQIGAPTSARLVASTTAKIIQQTNRLGIEKQFVKASLVHCTTSGETSWHGFSEAIFEGARQRGAQLKVREVKPISSGEYPTVAARPENSRLSLTRLKETYAIETPNWRDELDYTLDEIYGLR